MKGFTISNAFVRTMTMTQHLFKSGDRYRAKRSCMSGPPVLITDELLTFTSRDCSYWRHRDEPAESWQELSELLAD